MEQSIWSRSHILADSLETLLADIEITACGLAQQVIKLSSSIPLVELKDPIFTFHGKDQSCDSPTPLTALKSDGVNFQTG